MPEQPSVHDRRKPVPPLAAGERRSSNRRAFPRWPVTFEVRYGATAKEMTPAEGYEIGEGGLSFKCDQHIPVESELQLEYKLNDEIGWVKLRGIVRHSRAKRIGTEFLNLRMKDRLALVRFIAETR